MTIIITRTPLLLGLVVLCASLAGCEQRAPVVYVLDSPQTVVLTPSASASQVRLGETITLHVERKTTGTWKQVPRNELKPGQCWVYRPPVEIEKEVAHGVQWQVVPENAVEFHTEYQLDQSRVATLRAPGKVRLTPISSVKCEAGRSVAGSSLEIEVS